MKLHEKQLEAEYIYKGKIINVRRDKALLPNGAEAFREVVEHPGGVTVAALTDKDEVLFVRQFRYPYEEVILEIPAGKRDSRDEAPLECGKRELREETGATAEKYISLGELYPTPGYCGEVIYMFAATVRLSSSSRLRCSKLLIAFFKSSILPLGFVFLTATSKSCPTVFRNSHTTASNIGIL